MQEGKKYFDQDDLKIEHDGKRKIGVMRWKIYRPPGPDTRTAEDMERSRRRIIDAHTGATIGQRPDAVTTAINEIIKKIS